MEIEAETRPLLQQPQSPRHLFESWSQSCLAPFERIVVKQIDIRLMPLLCLFYILNYLDRNNIASARLADLENDLGLTEKQYDTCVSIFYVGYISMQVPSNIVLSHITRPAIYICGCMTIWGILSACTALAQNFTGLLLCRFFLGFAESVFLPGAMFYISSWYTKKELALRTAFLFSGSQISGALGNLIAIGLLKLDGALGLAGWRWLFLVEGLVTATIALLGMLILPDLPSSSSSSHLTPMQHHFAVWRLHEDAALRDTEGGEVPANVVGRGMEKVNVVEAFCAVIADRKTWMFCGILTCAYTASAVTNFFPSVIHTLGYSRNITLLLTAPPYLLCCITMMFNGLHSDKTQERSKHLAYPLAVTVLAHILALSTTATAPRYLAMIFLLSSIYASIIVTLTWASETLSQPPEKRAAAIAFLNAFAHTANIWTPYLYTGPPRYLLAFSVNIAAASLGIVCTALVRWHLKRLNEAEEMEGRKGQYIL